jgi:hypothetical protein
VSTSRYELRWLGCDSNERVVAELLVWPSEPSTCSGMDAYGCGRRRRNMVRLRKRGEGGGDGQSWEWSRGDVVCACVYRQDDDDEAEL